MNAPLRNFSTAIKVIEDVCLYFGVTTSELESRSRVWRVAWPRFVAMWEIRKYTTYDALTIGLLLGRRSGDVYHALRRVEDELRTSFNARRDVKELDRNRSLASFTSSSPPPYDIRRLHCDQNQTAAIARL